MRPRHRCPGHCPRRRPGRPGSRGPPASRPRGSRPRGPRPRGPRLREPRPRGSRPRGSRLPGVDGLGGGLLGSGRLRSGLAERLGRGLLVGEGPAALTRREATGESTGRPPPGRRERQGPRRPRGARSIASGVAAGSGPGPSRNGWSPPPGPTACRHAGGSGDHQRDHRRVHPPGLPEQPGRPGCRRPQGPRGPRERPGPRHGRGWSPPPGPTACLHADGSEVHRVHPDQPARCGQQARPEPRALRRSAPRGAGRSAGRRAGRRPGPDGRHGHGGRELGSLGHLLLGRLDLGRLDLGRLGLGRSRRTGRPARRRTTCQQRCPRPCQ